MKIVLRYRILPILTLGMVAVLISTPTLAASGDVDDNPPGLFEIGLNEDTLEDVDNLITKGPNTGTNDARANILGCVDADEDTAVAQDCRDTGNDSGSDLPTNPPPGQGPDWADLFTGVMNGPDRIYVEHSFKDEVEFDGGYIVSGSNTVDDYIDYGAITAVFIGDHISAGGAVDDTTLVSKGSDSNDDLIPTYVWGTDSVPSKDDITNAYCYATTDLDDDLIIYCGVERLSNDGASHVDIELNKNFVGLDEEPPCDKSACYFVGDRADGDLMVSLDFTNGGDFGSLEIRIWDDTLETWGEPVVELQEEGCNGEITNGHTIPAGAACGYNNNGPINGGPWPNFIKDTTPIDSAPDFTTGMLPRNAFSEFGLNVKEILGEAQCISYLQMKTRTSHSFTSQLKDFAIRPFPVCGSTIRTEIHDEADTGSPHSDIQDTTVKIGTVIHDFAEVKINGPGVTIDPTGTVDFTLYDNGTCDGNVVGTDTGVSLVGGNPDDATATARSKAFSGLGVGTYSFHATFTPTPGSPYPSTVLPDLECEVITIDKYESKIRTEIHRDGGHGPDIQNTSVNVLTTVHDHAYVAEKTGNFSGAPTPTGNVTFEIYGNTSCSGVKLGSFGGISWDQVSALSGGTAVTAAFTPLAGSFGIKAKYGGDSNYKSAVDSNCEPLTVNKLNPSIVTKVIVRDLANVSGSGPAPTGTVTFKTYSTNNCTGAETNTAQVTLSSGSAEQPANKEVTLEVGKATASYVASYSGDLNYKPITHKCEVVEFKVLDPVPSS